MTETTVYSIFAGYIPQIALGKDDFISKKQLGSQKRTYSHGFRYDGKKRNLSGITTGIHTDGNLGAARVRGSVAWYEHTTNKREVDITNALQQPDGGDELAQEINDLARQWYGGGALPGWHSRQETRDRALLNAFENMMGHEHYPIGEPIKGGVKAEPEEQSVRRGAGAGSSQWKPDDKEMRDLEGGRPRVIQANSIDVYFRDAKGQIHRLDVTAQTLDDKAAHHGLSSWEDRKASHVTGQELLKTIESGEGGILKATTNLENYFNKIQEQSWNPPIRAMKEIIRSQQLPAADLLKELSDPNNPTSLKSLNLKTNKKLQELLWSMRGKGVEGGGTVRTGGKRNPGQEATGEVVKSSGGGWQQAANAIRQWYLSEAGQIAGKPPGKQDLTMLKKLGLGKGKSPQVSSWKPKGALGQKTEAMNAGLEFALHMLGNVMELFRGDSARQGGYSTAYTMGEGGSKKSGKKSRAANFVVEVQHSISPSGKDVFEFMKLEMGDVIIHSEAALTTAYQKALWYAQKSDAKAIVAGNIIRQNQLHTLQVMGLADAGIRIGDAVTVAHEIHHREASAPVPGTRWVMGERNPKTATHAGSGKILPQSVNDSINLWLHGGKTADGKKVEGVVTRRGIESGGKIDKLIKMYTKEFAPVYDEGAQKQASIKANRGVLPALQKGRERRLGIPGSQSLLDRDPLATRGGSMGNLQSWKHGMTQTGKGNISEASLRARMGMDPVSKNKEWTNVKKYLFGDDEAMMRMGISMALGAGRQKSESRAGGLSFWGTPYLSVLYPSTQVRLND